ncbi:MAG: magnesium transporter MgtE N-terminal domain-containing protein [Candidatus Scalindua sp.]
MIKIKLDIKKYFPYILFFIVFFSVSSVAMIVLKKGIEEKLKKYYSAKLLETREKYSHKEGSGKAVNEEKEKEEKKEAVRMIRKFAPNEIRKYQKELRRRIDLYEKKVALLDKKEKEIEAFETDVEGRKGEIATMRKELDEALTFISAERIDLDSDLVVFSESERKNLKRLADIYASMEALKAADVLSKLKHDTSAKVLSGMPTKKSAKILSEFNSSGAATICEQMKNLQVVNSTSGESLKGRNIKRLAAIYQKMDTEKAVSIIKKLDNETAASILSKMDKKKLAKILEVVGTNEASRLTDEIRKILKSEFQERDEKIEGA